MRDLLFLVADKNMQYAFRGLFSRDALGAVLGCGPIDFDWRSDIVVASGQNDPGLYTRSGELLKVYKGQYRHAVVAMDAEWNGSPGPEKIRERLHSHLTDAGWPPPAGLALVLEPEVDIWLWSDSPHTASALGWDSREQLQSALIEQRWLKAGEIKPERPKEAAAWALRHKRKPRSSNVYAEVTKRVSILRCQEPAAQELLHALQAWFPAGGDV